MNHMMFTIIDISPYILVYNYCLYRWHITQNSFSRHFRNLHILFNSGKWLSEQDWWETNEAPALRIQFLGARSWCRLPRLLLWDFPGSSTERWSPGGASCTSWVGGTELRVRTPRRQEFIGQSTKEVKATQRENPGELHRIHLKYSAEYWRAHVCKGTTQSRGKQLPKWLKRTVINVQRKLGNSSSQQPDLKFSWSWDIGWSTHKYLALVVGNT